MGGGGGGVILQVAATLVGILGLCLIMSCCSFVESVPNTNVTTILCNSEVYTKGDPFVISLAYVLDDLETVTPSSRKNNYSYRDISPYPNAFAYGQAKCNQNLSSSDCGTCLDAAKTAMLSSCVSRIGARSVLIDCSMRYEQYPFSD